MTKVKQLRVSACPELLNALRNGEITIHRAWQWCKEPSNKQASELYRYRSERGIHKTIRALMSRHRPEGLSKKVDVAILAKALSALGPTQLRSIEVALVKATGKRIIVTDELVQALETALELSLKCDTDNR